jgi:hypothetical protein
VFAREDQRVSTFAARFLDGRSLCGAERGLMAKTIAAAFLRYYLVGVGV